MQKIIEEQQKLSETLKPTSSSSKEECDEQPELLPEGCISQETSQQRGQGIDGCSVSPNVLNSSLLSTRRICEDYPKNNILESDDKELGFTSPDGEPPSKKKKVTDGLALKTENEPGLTEIGGS